MDNAPGGQDPRPTRTPGTRIAGFARTPAGIGALAVVALAGVLAVGSIAGGVSGSAGQVAAASSSAPTPSAAPSGSPTAALSPGPTSDVPSADPAPTPSATPTPAVTPAPSPSGSPLLSSTDGVPAKALQARLDKLRKKLQIPGTSVAILWDDGRRWLGASGMRDVAAGDPMTTGTAFALASVSKTATAAVVLQLVEEGKLSLDEKVAPLLPAFDMNPKITVRQLLDHTSGLPDFFLNAKIDSKLRKDKNATWTAEQTWAYVPDKRPTPGRFWIYSNSNYLLLGELVEAVTGRPLAVEVRERLFDPLGLETAWFQAEEEPRATGTLAYRLVAARGGTLRAVPVARKSGVMPFRSVVTAAGGAGSLAATAVDAARWMRAFAGGDVLTPAMQREMLADVARTTALKSRIPYGLGIQSLPIAGRYALGHSGRFLGFRNVVRYLPAEGVTIAVLTNQGVIDPTKIAEPLLKLVLPPLPGASPSASGSPAP
jgi:CubicO group peptidase (beta-lactamase class C family)